MFCVSLPVSRSTQSARNSTFSRTVRGWLPVLALRRRSASSFFASVSMAVVSQMFFPSMTGEDHARPGNSVFQVTLFVSLHDAGRPVACA